jgi:LPXTG-motif cell wall-anchored protein
VPSPRNRFLLTATAVAGVLALGLVPAGAALAAPSAAPAAAAAPWPLVVTEIAPDNASYDDYEFFEVHNTSDADIDLADGYSIRYGSADSDAVDGGVLLTVEGDTTVRAGETIVYWLSYRADNVDSYAKTENQFRARWNVPAEARVVRVSGQPGMANTSARGIRLISDGELVSRSFYPADAVGADLTAHFKLPADLSSKKLDVFQARGVPTPGVVDPAALVEPVTDVPDPVFDPQPDPTVTAAPLHVTEVLPDSTNVGTGDGYEFIEVYNATSDAIDFSDYAINYLYPDTDTSSLWPATPSNVVIPAGETLVFWIKNGQNDTLGQDAFNAQFGTSLTLGVNLVEIFSGGLANSGARGVEIVTNTGYPVSSAYYNMTAADDTKADQGIRYAASADDLAVQRIVDIVPATPGAVQSDQVPAGLMIVPADSVAPTITDLTEGAIDPAADFAFSFRISDDVQARTATLTLSNDVDAQPVAITLQDSGDGVYSHVIPAVDLTGKASFEYSVTASDGTNETVLETVRVRVRGVDTSPVRLNVAEGQYVSKTTEVIAAGDEYPADLDLTIDGEPAETAPSLERAPVFAFDVTGVNYYFKNGVRVGDDVLRIFDDTINDWTSLATPVPLSHVVQGDELVVSVWAGTKKAPEIDLGENNDDFDIRNLRMILPDGRTLTPIGYDNPATVLRMGDSAGKLDFYDARFALPANAFSAVVSDWDTTGSADGPVTIAATDGVDSAVRSVLVDNTAPVVSSTIVDGSDYKGKIVIDAEATDAGSGVVSTVATLDGESITLPHTTSSVDLAAGDHELEIVATDQLGNVETWTATFVTFEEQPSAGALAPLEGAEVEAGEVTLQAKVEDPTGDVLDVSFLEGRRLDLADGEVRMQSGTVNDALDTNRAEPAVLSKDQLQSLASADGVSADVSSDAEFPYQLFDVSTADAGAGVQVRATWTGRANDGATVILYALRSDGSEWDEVARHVSTADDEQFTLEGIVDAGAHSIGGAVRMLVQHSEGFAGENLSSRESTVTPAHPEDTPRADYDFSFGWESDTQYYNEDAVADEPRYEHQQAIHSYFLAQREAMNLQYVFHTGDIVDDWDQEEQWLRADPEYQRLDDAGLPYGVLAGNHDVGHELGDYTDYSNWFGEDRFAANPWYGGSYKDNRGHYDLISAGGIDFLMVYQGWGPGDEEIAWMNEVLAQYPDRIAVVAQHEYLLTTGGLGEIPQRIMDEVVATNPNVKMVFSGHYHDAFTRTDDFDDTGDGVADRTVTSMLFDYQGLPEGGLGYLRLLQFDNEGERMVVRTYSPSLNDYDSDAGSLADAPQEFEISYDQLAIVPGVRTLGTDAFTAEILTANEIAAFTDVPSGTVLSATWQLDDLGDRGWYVRSADAFGAVDYSPITMFTVVAAAVDPDPGTDEPGTDEPGAPDDGEPGGGEPGAGDPGTESPTAGTPAADATPAADGSLPATGSDASTAALWALGAGVLVLLGGALAVRRRLRRS